MLNDEWYRIYVVRISVVVSNRLDRRTRGGGIYYIDSLSLSVCRRFYGDFKRLSSFKL